MTLISWARRAVLRILTESADALTREHSGHAEIGASANGTSTCAHADDSLREVRRALFSAAVLRARRRAREAPISDAEIAMEVDAVRGGRST